MDVKEILLQALKENGFTDAQLREGTGINEFLVKGANAIYSAFSALMQHALEEAFLKNYESIPPETMDLLVSNFLITRRQASTVKGFVRIYFESPRDVDISDVVYFGTGDGRRYFVSMPRIYSRSEVLQNFDAGLGLYYIDVQVEAEAPGNQYNVQPGEINRVFNFSDYVFVTNLNPLEVGDVFETNEKLYERTKRSLAIRGLVNVDAVITTLYDTFPGENIQTISVISMGDPELWRDEYEGVHVGARTDIYIDMPLQPVEQDINTDKVYDDPENNALKYIEIGDVDLLLPFGFYDNTGKDVFTGGAHSAYFDDERIRCDDGILDWGIGNDESGGTNASGLFIVEAIDDLPLYKKEYSGSSSQKLRIYFNADDFLTVTFPLKLIGYKLPSENIRDFVRGSQSRVVTSDMIVKHFWRAYVEIQITLLRGDKVQARNLLIDYLDNLKSAEPEPGNIIRYLEENMSDVVIKLPFDVFNIHIVDDKYEVQALVSPEFPLNLPGRRHILFESAIPYLGETGVIVE